jgi:threonine dehydrogenase-like Zn-dependent dehydrogenase
MPLPERAQAAVMTDFNKPLILRDFALPRELPEGDLLVRVDLAGMCGTDVHLHRGQLPIPLPVILGHESVGTIVAMGSPRPDWTGRDLSVGDRVTWSVGLWCDQCWFCRVARIPTRCINRTAYGVSTPCDAPPHLLGGYAQYHYLHARCAVLKLPDDLPGEAVVGAGCALVTAIHGVEKMGMTWGESVVIQGAGPVGLASMVVAKEAGACPVIMIGGPSGRLETARRFGADIVIDIDEVDDASARRGLVLEATEGRGADAVIECVGEPHAVVEGWELCRDGGRYLVLGHYGDAGPTLLNPHVITRKELSVYGSWGSEPRHTVKALQLLRTRAARYPFAELISHRYRLDQVNDALSAISRWETSKAAVVPNG